MNSSTSKTCPTCGSDLILETILEAGPHYSRMDCKGCGRFLGWGKNPRTIQRNQELEQKLMFLVEVSTLTDWEKAFSQSVFVQFGTSGKLSPKQMETVEKLFNKHKKQ